MDQDEVWTFTVGMYGRDGVAKLCLELQERLGQPQPESYLSDEANSGSPETTST